MKLHGYNCLTYLADDDLAKSFQTRHLPYKKVEKIDEQLVQSMNLHSSDLIITLTGSKSLNLFLSRYIKAELKHRKIITIISTALNDEIKGDETLEIVDMDKILADRIEDMIMRPDSFSGVAESFEDYGIEEVRMSNASLDRALVKSIAFPQTGSLVILRRGNEIFIPHGNTHLLLGDIITVIGNSDALINFREIFHGTRS
jgi:Trk K+ transport system NAD-binding subunit